MKSKEEFFNHYVKAETYWYSDGRLHIENDIGQEEWDGAMLL